MLRKHILVVEDEEDIASVLSYNLEQDGYTVDTLNSGDEVLPFLDAVRPDLILLDVMIPGMDGFEVCKSLKATPEFQSIPVIFITAKMLERNIISGLEIGADDYIVKPFSISVVLSRINAVLRRSNQTAHGPSDQSDIQIGSLTIDQNKMTVFSHHVPIDLTTTEYKVMEVMIKKPGWVFNRSQLLDACKGDDSFVTDRSIDVLMVSIRKKLGDQAYLIETIRGVGYRLKDN